MIAVSKQEDTGAGSPVVEQTVVVEVDAVQAHKLALALQIGRLSVTLGGLSACEDELFIGDCSQRPARPTGWRIQDQPFDPNIFPWYSQNL